MIAIFKTACLMGATLLVKSALAVAQPMLAPVVWGRSGYGGDTTLNNNEDITSVARVVCGAYACVGLKTDGSAVTWGHSSYGGDTQDKDLSGMAKVVCGDGFCAGLKTDGSVVSWGEIAGDTPDVSGVAQIACGIFSYAFAALKTDGSVVAWGESARGGDTQGKDVTGVAQIACGGSACAGLKTDGTVVTWGNSGYGGDTQGKDVTGVAQIVCGGNSCAGLKTDGSIVAWGHSDRGGDTQGKDMSNMAQVACGGEACAGLKTDGTVVAWGNSEYGGDTQGKDVSGVAHIVCGGGACAGLKTDGSIVAWGHSDRGGDTQGKDVSGIAQVVCGWKACAGLKIDGSVVAWGESANGGDTQGKLITGANQITCGGLACAAWYAPDTAGGGGDPHFIGFGDIYFTWQGHCDLVLVKSTKHIDTDTHFEVHVRTTRIRKWSKIDTIAIKVGQDVGEISSDNGKFILNGHEVNEVQNQELTVVKSVKNLFSKLGKGIYLYDITFQRDKKLEIEVDTRTHMIYTKLSGNYPQDTEGILGSPHQPGLVTRNGKYISSTNVNAFVETWQVRDDDSHLFNVDRAPQYPSKCLYDTKKITLRHHARHLKEVRNLLMEEAAVACSIHHPGPLKNFCVDDVIMTGDLDSARDEFYE